MIMTIHPKQITKFIKIGWW